jgi:glycine betaine catabolism B
VTRELYYWLLDIRQHWSVRQERQALRRPGCGVDYTRDRHTVQNIVSRLHPPRMRLQVSEIVAETPTSRTLRFRRLDGELPPFRPGQYVNLFVDVDGVPTSRPYSIASPPGQPFLEITVRDKPGGFVAPYLLHEIAVGDELESTGPAGHFYHEPLIDGDDLVFLAGGSGITPFMSIIRDAIQGERRLRMHLIYGCRTPADVIYGDELALLAEANPNLVYTLVISEPPPDYEGLTGLLDAALIQSQVGDVEGKTFYLCGPNVMTDYCQTALRELGVPRHRIRRELYGPPADVTREPGWPAGLPADTLFAVQVEGHRTIRALAGEPLLNALERYELVVPSVCRSGECSACRIRLLSGRVYMPPHTGLREADRAHNYIHACASYPLTDLVIRL